MAVYNNDFLHLNDLVREDTTFPDYKTFRQYMENRQKGEAEKKRQYINFQQLTILTKDKNPYSDYKPGKHA